MLKGFATFWEFSFYRQKRSLSMILLVPGTYWSIRVYHYVFGAYFRSHVGPCVRWSVNVLTPVRTCASVRPFVLNISSEHLLFFRLAKKKEKPISLNLGLSMAKVNLGKTMTEAVNSKCKRQAPGCPITPGS